MSGHSKWSKIKRQKAKTDAQKGATFTKVSKEIIIATRQGGEDIDHNFRLRTAIDKAKVAGMPNDNIKRAILKGSGNLDSEQFEEIQYEGYGIDGVAVLVLVATDNRNRTAGDLRFAFSKGGGNMGENGCVSFLFERKGLIVINAEEVKSMDDLLMDAADAGADDVKENEEIYEVLTAPDDLMNVEKGLKEKYKVESAELTYLPTNTVEITNPDNAKKFLRMLDTLENHDDVQQVFSNAEINDDIIDSSLN